MCSRSIGFRTVKAWEGSRCGYGYEEYVGAPHDFSLPYIARGLN